MASQAGFCGDGCSFDTVDIDCSMAFRMVESTIRRIMDGLEERKGDEIVFAGLIKTGDAVSMVLNSRNSSRLLSSIPPQPQSFDPFTSPESPCSYSSSAPLLAQSSSVPQGLEDLSSRESPQGISSPFAPPWVARHRVSQPRNHPHTTAISHQHQQLTSSELAYLSATDGPPDCEQSRPSSGGSAKVNTFSSPSVSSNFHSRPQAGLYPSIQGVLAQAGRSKNQGGVSFGSEKAIHPSSPQSIKETPIRCQGRFFKADSSHPVSVLSLCKTSSSPTGLLEEFKDLVPLLPYCFPPSTASSSGEMTEQKSKAARRTDTPPKSIFDDYRSAYNSILSPDRNFSGISQAGDPAQSSNASPELSLPNNPFVDLFSGSDRPQTPPPLARSAPTVASNGSHKSRRPSSPKSKRRTNFSRPLSLSPSSDRLTKPVTATVRDSISVFSLGSPVGLGHDKRPNTKQPNLQGARGRVERSSAIGSIVKRYSDGSDSNGRSTESNRGTEARTSLDMFGCGQGVLEGSSTQSRVSPAGQPPNIPLPPDPSYVAAKGLVGEALSDASLYEDTEKLLNLTQPTGASAVPEQATSHQLYRHGTAPKGGLNSEFSWIGNKGMSSFRDLSTKELKQLQNPSRASQRSLTGDGAEVPVGSRSSNDQYLLSDAVYEPQDADSVTNAKRRTELLPQHLAEPLSRDDLARSWATDWDDEENSQAGPNVDQDVQTDSVLEFGGLQSSSSRGISLDVSLGDDASRPEISMAGSSRARVVGRGNAGNASWSIRAKGVKSMRSAEKDVEDNPFAGGVSDEGGEWETLGESGMRSKIGAQVSLGRSTSGSSLANVSSNESVQEDRGVPSPWDPLKTYPALITPPNKAVIPQSGRHNSQVQGPATAPRNTPPLNEDNEQQTLRRTSSTPVLSFSLTPKYQVRRGTSPTYRHPAPLGRDHQNPFNSSPPPVDLQDQGPSIELSELGDKHTDKRHAIYANSIHSLHQQIHKPVSSKNQTHLKNPFTNPDMSSEKSEDGSYSTMHTTNLAEDGGSILSPNSPHTPKSAKSFTKGSGKRTKLYLNKSEEVNMTESARYQRLREEMGCGTGGIVRVPGMQQVAPPRAHIPEQFIGPTKPFRAAAPLPELPPRNSFELTRMEPLSPTSTKEEIADRMILANDDMAMMKKDCPTFPINEQMLQTFFRNKDGTLSQRPKAKRGTVFERDGRVFEQAWCDGHQRWEFSHTPHLTRRMPKEDIKIQREMGQKLIRLLFLSVVGWIFLVFVVAWDPMNGRGELIREYSNGAVHTFHQKEIALARMATAVIVAVVAVLLVMVGLYV